MSGCTSSTALCSSFNASMAVMKHCVFGTVPGVVDAKTKKSTRGVNGIKMSSVASITLL